MHFRRIDLTYLSLMMGFMSGMITGISTILADDGEWWWAAVIILFAIAILALAVSGIQLAFTGLREEGE